MITFIKRENELLLEYEPVNGVNWIFDKFKKGFPCKIKNTFKFTKENLYYDEVEVENGDLVVFKLGTIEGNSYYKIKGEILEIDVDLYIDNSMNIDRRMFIAYQNISIFKRIGMIVNEDIRIGNAKTDVPIYQFLIS